MKSNYHERQANRMQAFKELADKNESLSNSSYERAHKLGDMIPMGQPILVGHHSERGHRAHIKKIDNAMRTSVEASRKAKYYSDRAENLLNGTAISSDNPDAISLLQEKLANLEALQELYKQINKICRSVKTSTDEKLAALIEIGLNETRARKVLQPHHLHGMGIPSYRLTNNNACIKNAKDRIERLQKLESMETTEETINGVILKVNVEENRVQLIFQGKPADNVRTELKKNGFRFCYTEMAWQRQISNWAVYIAKDILNKI